MIAAILVAVFAGGNIRLSDTVKVTRSTHSVYLSDTAIDDTVITKLGRLKKMVLLDLRDCTVTGDLAALKVSGSITSLRAENTTFTDLTFLSAFTQLGTLSLEDCTFSGDGFKDMTLSSVTARSCSPPKPFPIILVSVSAMSPPTGR